MSVQLHPHARARAVERGATEAEIIATVEAGNATPTKFGRTLFKHTFPFDQDWQGRRYAAKKIEAIAIQEDSDWLVITVVVKFY
jgi:hypothetical protein